MKSESLYSRQIGAYGSEMMQKISGLSILLSGLKGLGVEVAKNLILSGIQKLSIHDNSIVDLRDMASNYCIESSDVSVKTRAKACFKKLKALNPSTNLKICKETMEEIDFEGYQVVILTESNQKIIDLVSAKCREKKIGFISAENWGALCHIFTDFGPEFTIYDNLGISYDDIYITDIKQSDPGIVTTSEPHKLALDIFLQFDEIKGMTELNKCEPIPILSIKSPKSFEIPSTLNFSPYLKDGMVRVIKPPIKKQYSTYQECYTNPRLNNNNHITDFTKPGRKWQLHLAVLSILKYSENFLAIPKLLNDDDSTLCLNYAKEINSLHCLVEEVDEDLIKKASKFASVQISAIASSWGGIVAQEALKITGKYTSIYQWAHLDFFDLVTNCELPQTNDRYFDIKALIGERSFEKLREKNVFLAGAGALGCEFVKHLAILGIGSKNHVVVTDNDNIELSNLSRQFLFRTEDIGKSKSKTAVKAASKINSEAKLHALTEKVSADNEETFSESFWQDLDVVFLAVDNREGRKYIDKKCVWHKKILLEAGTLGLRASSTNIIPMQTLTYSDLPQGTKKEIAMCTLKSFPYLISHCIEWARQAFEEFFNASIEDLNKFNSNPAGFCEEIRMMQTSCQQYEKILQLLTMLFLRFEETKEKIIEGVCMFYLSIFRDNILELIHFNPPDSKNEDGTLFWSGTKRLPISAELTQDDECVEFLYACCKILQSSSKSSLIIEKSQIKSFVANYEPYIFKPKLYNNEEKLKIFLEKKLNYLKTFEALQNKLEPISFEKDDDTNFHVDFIWHASNIRAKSYGLQATDRIQAKLISGKIVPAVISTSSIISGFVAVEFIKTALFDSFKSFKNVNMNLAIPSIRFMNPSEPVILKDEEGNLSKFTVWDFLEVQGPMKLEQFLIHIRDKLEADLDIAQVGDIVIYFSAIKEEFEGLMQLNIEDVYQLIAGENLKPSKKSFEITIEGFRVGTDEKKLIPRVKYYFT